MKFIGKIVLMATLTLGSVGCSYIPFTSDDYADLDATTPAPRSSVDAAAATAGASEVTGSTKMKISVDDPVDYNLLKVPDQPPPLGTTNFVPMMPEELNPTGTLVGHKVQQMREDLVLLQKSIVEENQRLQAIRNETQRNSQFYHNMVARINTRLQVGTTPGNPQLIQDWNKAQDQLALLNQDIGDMNNLSNEVANSATLAGYLLDASRAAYGLSGAVDADHRQLGILENDINRTVVLIDRLLDELSRDISRQSNYMNNEKRNMTTLSLAIKNGELYGRSLSNYERPFMPAPMYRGSNLGAPTAGGRQFSAAPAPRAPVMAEQPLVVIRFADARTDYEQPLYDAVSQALERKPDVEFSLVSVIPFAGSAASSSKTTIAAHKNAEKVVRSLVDMGVDQSRVMVSAEQLTGVDNSEVRLYVR